MVSRDRGLHARRRAAISFHLMSIGQADFIAHASGRSRPISRKSPCALDAGAGPFLIGWLTGAMYEVLSMSHAVVSAEDTGRLIERIEQVAPEEQRQADIASFREGRIGKYADMTYGPKPEGK